jgi:hypothetical protein
MDPAAVGQPRVNEWHSIVKTPANRGSQALGEPPYLIVMSELK